MRIATLVYRFDYRVPGHHVNFEFWSCGRGWEVRACIDGTLARSQSFVTLASAAHWAEEERLAMQEEEEQRAHGR